MSHLNAYLKAWLVAVLGLFTVHSAVYSQTERMFSISLDNSLTLVRTDKQQALLEKITQRETTAKVHLFLVDDIAEMANSTALRFGTQNEIIYSINNAGKKAVNGSMSLWQGKSNASDPNMTTLVFDGGDITGSVWLHGRLYKIEPLGEGVHAFIEFDQSKVLECGQPLEPKEESTGGKTLDKSNVMLQTDPPVIDVLVAYTTAAKNASGNINSLIQLAVAEANQSYKNSDVTLYMNLVYTYEVSYTETGNTSTDLGRFTNTSDGYMDNVHTLRDQYGADVCVLIISSTTDGTVGRAWLNPGASEAFSVVRYDYATGYYTFAHEIGHNLNCRHDPCDDSAGTYNHGYRYCNGSWRTIMAPYNQSCCNSNRIQYWSNPDKTYNGVAMGTAQYEDNARMLEEDSPGVAAFRSSFTSGTLTTNQTWYYKTLTGNVTVADGVTLTIMPGATLNFTGNYKLRVEGTLIANGTYTNKITFTRSGGTWYGIEFYNASGGSIIYSIIQNAQYGIRSINSYPGLASSTVKYNTVGVYFDNNSFIYGGALQNNIIEENGDGVKCYQYSDPGITTNNVIRYNNFYGVYGDGTSIPHLGTYSSEGHNSLYYNGIEVSSSYSGTIYARYNWWGDSNPTPNVSGNVDWSNYLDYDPNSGMGKALAKGIPSENRSSKIASGAAADTVGMVEVDHAYKLFLKGNGEQALALFEGLVGKYPDHFAGRRALAFVSRCLYKLDRRNEAIARMNQLVQNHGGKEVFGLAQSIATGELVKNGQYAEAIAKSQAILSDFPKTTLAKYALYDLGSIYWYRLEDQKTGEAYYRQLIAEWPDDDLTISALATLGEWNPKPDKGSAPVLTNTQNVPAKYALSQNFPNPFNPQTMIQYQLPEVSHITLKIYNLFGQEVRTLVAGQREAGYHKEIWDGRDDFGRRVASGVYFYRLSAEPNATQPNGFQFTRKMVLTQ